MNVEVLKIAYEQEHRIFMEAIADSKTTEDAAFGVARILLDNGGDISALKGKQKYVYESCIEPLFNVACEGIYGDGTCTGTGQVDEESLLMSYIEDEFLCQHCRYDQERHAAE